MNKIKGTITHIEVSQSLSLVRINVRGLSLNTIVIDTPETAAYLKVGNQIEAIFKATEVAIAINHHQLQISMQNKLEGTVQAIEHGQLLSREVVNTQAGAVTSVITTNAVQQLGLTEGLKVVALVKTNEVMLSELWSGNP